MKVIPPRKNALLVDRFAFEYPALLCSRVRLFDDGIVLTGWSWKGRYRRRLPLRHVLQIDIVDRRGILLWLASGETIRLRVRKARRWKEAVARIQEGRRRKHHLR